MRKIVESIALVILSMLWMVCISFSNVMAYGNTYDDGKSCIKISPFTRVELVSSDLINKEFVGDKYSKWHRKTEVKYATSKNETMTVSKEENPVEFSISASVTGSVGPFALNVGIDKNLEYSGYTDSDSSRPLAQGESCAYYTRSHWKVWNITIANLYKYWDGMELKYFTDVVCGKFLEPCDPYDEDEYDFTWAYSFSKKDLTKSLESDVCDGENPCVVLEKTSPNLHGDK